jgi:hypothetical protein
MTTSLRTRLDTATNIALIGVALLIGAVLVKKHFLSDPPERSAGRRDFIAPGATLPLPGIEWKTHPRSLVLAMSTKCHYCGEGAPFYRQLAASAGQQGIRLMAVFPQPVEEGRKYLKSLDVPIGQVGQVDFRALKIRGTPALLLVNKDGVVENVWPGKLSPERQSQVMAALGSPAHSAL